jgi:Helix-turn-helix domain
MSIADFSELRADADDRRAVLAACVDTALGPLAGRATATVDELFGLGRATAYEMVKRGDVPSLRLGGRRIVVPVPALVALLLSADTYANGGGTQPNGAEASRVERRREENAGPIGST